MLQNGKANEELKLKLIMNYISGEIERNEAARQAGISPTFMRSRYKISYYFFCPLDGVHFKIQAAFLSTTGSMTDIFFVTL